MLTRQSLTGPVAEVFGLGFFLILNLHALLNIHGSAYAHEQAYLVTVLPALAIILAVFFINLKILSRPAIANNLVFLSAGLVLVAIVVFFKLNLTRMLYEWIYIALLAAAFFLVAIRWLSLSRSIQSVGRFLSLFFLAALVYLLLQPLMFNLAGPIWVLFTVNTSLVALLWFGNRSKVFIVPATYMMLAGFILVMNNFDMNKYVTWKVYSERTKLLPTINANLNVSKPEWDHVSRRDTVSIRMADGSMTRWMFEDGSSFGPVQSRSYASVLSNYPVPAYPLLIKGISSALLSDLPMLDMVAKKQGIRAEHTSMDQLLASASGKQYDLININLRYPHRPRFITDLVNHSSQLTRENIAQLTASLSDSGRLAFVTDNQAYIVKLILMLMHSCSQAADCKDISSAVSIFKLNQNYISSGNPYVFLLVYDKTESNTLAAIVNKAVINTVYIPGNTNNSFYGRLLAYQDVEQAEAWLGNKVFRKNDRIFVDVPSANNPAFYILNRVPGLALTLPLGLLAGLTVLLLVFKPATRQVDSWAPLPAYQLMAFTAGAAISMLVVASKLSPGVSSVVQLDALAVLIVFLGMLLSTRLAGLKTPVLAIATVLMLASIQFEPTGEISLVILVALLSALLATGMVLASLDTSATGVSAPVLASLVVAGILTGAVVSQYLFKTASLEKLVPFILAILCYNLVMALLARFIPTHAQA